MNKKQQNALYRVMQSATLIQELVPLEMKRESQQRRKALEKAYESLRCHCATLGIEAPLLSVFYHPKQYLEHATSVLQAINEMKGHNKVEQQ